MTKKSLDVDLDALPLVTETPKPKPPTLEQQQTKHLKEISYELHLISGTLDRLVSAVRNLER